MRFKPSKKIFKRNLNLPIILYNPVGQAGFDSYLWIVPIRMQSNVNNS